MSANPSCTNTVPSTCCASGFPQSLTATIKAPATGPFSACTAIDNASTQVEYVGFNGGFHMWTGDVMTGCGALTVIFEVEETAPGASCDQYVTVKNNSGQTCFGRIHNAPKCPIGTHDFGPSSWNNGNCNCCPFPENSSMVTVTIEE